MACSQCPAAYLIHGVTRHHAAVVCRVESTDRGQREEKAGPVSLVRAAQSPSSFHGFCLGRMSSFVVEMEDVGAEMTPIERYVSDHARTGGDQPSYTDCPSWREETRNRMTAKLVDQPGQRRVHKAPQHA